MYIIYNIPIYIGKLTLLGEQSREMQQVKGEQNLL